MKVAILVSGSLRTFNSVWPRNEKVLASSGLNYDLYLQTWDNNIGTHREVAKALSPRRLFWRWFPTKFESLSFYEPRNFVQKDLNFHFSIDRLSKVEALLPEIKKIASIKNVRRFENSVAMYLGMERVAQLAIDSQIGYTHFVRLRTDFLLHESFNLDSTESLVMCGDGVKFDGHLISDQCFYGPFDLIKPVMFNFSYLRRIVRIDGWYSANYKKYRKAEFVLFENLANSNLLHLAKRIPRRRFGKIQREVEVRDDSVKLIKHYQNLLIHNKSVIQKLYKLYLADIRGSRVVAQLKKYHFKK
jgi:hypothetical protein